MTTQSAPPPPAERVKVGARDNDLKEWDEGDAEIDGYTQRRERETHKSQPVAPLQQVSTFSRKAKTDWLRMMMMMMMMIICCVQRHADVSASAPNSTGFAAGDLRVQSFNLGIII